MAFGKKYLTHAGSDLLSAVASGQQKLIWMTAKTTDLNLDSEDESVIRNKTSLDGGNYTGSGIVTAHITSDGEQSATISAQINNKEYTSGGNAYTLGIWAKTDADTNEKLVLIATHSDASSVTYITPASTDPNYTLFINFALRVDDWLNVTDASVNLDILANYYAAASDLDREVTERVSLLRRTVTTHSTTSHTVGDDQSIYGNKTFKNNVIISGLIVPSSDNIQKFLGAAGSGRWNIVYATTFNGTTFTGTANKATSDADGNTISSYYCTLSTDQAISGSKTFSSNVYIPTSATNNLYITGYTDGSGIRFSDNNASTSYSMIAGESHNNSCDFRQSYYVNNTLVGTIKTSCDSSGNMETTTQVGRSNQTTNNRWSLGAEYSKLKSVYATTFYGEATELKTAPSLSWTNPTPASSGTLSVTAGGKTSSAVNIDKVRYAYNLRYNSKDVLSALTDSHIAASASIIPTSDLEYYIGSKTYRFKGIYSNTFYGSLDGNIYIQQQTSSIDYPIVFSSSTVAGYKPLYTDNNVSSFCYNPGTNTLKVYNLECNNLCAGELQLYDVILEASNINANTVRFGDSSILEWDSANSCYRTDTFSDSGLQLQNSAKVMIKLYAKCLEGKASMADAANFDVSGLVDYREYNSSYGPFKFLKGNQFRMLGNSTRYFRCILYRI